MLRNPLQCEKAENLCHESDVLVTQSIRSQRKDLDLFCVRQWS